MPSETANHRGILLAGGRGTRLYPITATTSKQLTPVFNKPMVYYPLTTLMVAGIREILLISTPDDLPRFEDLLGDGSRFGIRLEYAVQLEPKGIAEALVIGEDFLDDRPSMLMLGDNIIYGRLDFLRTAVSSAGNDATIFGYQVADPTRYGVIEFDDAGSPVGIAEKPTNPRSNWAIPGMYLYPAGVSDVARSLDPSDRGELEITALNQRYLSEGRLQVVPMGRGIAWFDTGTPTALLEASNFIEAIERRQGLIVGSPEEVALRMGFIRLTDMTRIVEELPISEYRHYLEGVLEEL